MSDAQKNLLKTAQEAIAAALQSGSCPDVVAFTQQAIQLGEMDVDRPAQLAVMLDACKVLYLSGNPVSALSVATKALALADLLRDSRSAIFATTYIGVFSADTGNFPDAMEAYSSALATAQRVNDQLQETRIWTNLSAALCYSGLYREAIGAAHRGIDVAAQTIEATTIVPKLYANLALYHLNLQELSQGLAAIRRSLELAGGPKDAMGVHDRVLAESHFTRLLIEADDFTGAKEHALEAKRYAAMTKSPRSEVYANVALGLAEVFSGDSDQGITRLTAVLVQAQQLKLPTREILVALVKAHEHLKNHDQALMYLQQMLEVQRATQSANVLKHVERHLEQLHKKSGGLHAEEGRQVIKRLEERAELFEGRAAKAELGKTKQQLFSDRVELLERLAVTTELRDDSTGEHSYRVGKLASLLAQEAGCNDDMVQMMDIAGRLHDIGKIGIPDGVLLKPRAFNPAERIVMQAHAEIGADVLAKSKIPEIQMAADIARHHHERWDGQGYPWKLKGDKIPLCARIAALADVYDALSHARPYKQAWSVEASLSEIRACRGTHFDPELTDMFMVLMARLRAEHGTRLDDFLGEEARKTTFHMARQEVMDKINRSREQHLPKDFGDEAGGAKAA